MTIRYMLKTLLALLPVATLAACEQDPAENGADGAVPDHGAAGDAAAALDVGASEGDGGLAPVIPPPEN